MHKTSVFSPAFAFVLALWLYMVHVLVVLPIDSPKAHALALIGCLCAGLPLEWLRSRGNQDYAIAFLILLTLAPLVYAYQYV